MATPSTTSRSRWSPSRVVGDRQGRDTETAEARQGQPAQSGRGLALRRATRSSTMARRTRRRAMTASKLLAGDTIDGSCAHHPAQFDHAGAARLYGRGAGPWRHAASPAKHDGGDHAVMTNPHAKKSIRSRCRSSAARCRPSPSKWAMCCTACPFRRSSAKARIWAPGCSTRDFNTLCESESTPMHIGSIPGYLRGIEKTHRRGEWKAGDVVVHNHPYYGASHSPDLAIVDADFLSRANWSAFPPTPRITSTSAPRRRA